MISDVGHLTCFSAKADVLISKAGFGKIYLHLKKLAVRRRIFRSVEKFARWASSGGDFRAKVGQWIGFMLHTTDADLGPERLFFG
ncbi:hypothetical protein [Dyadobacter bucti]|uniref:hypothetical protein n=1 Tax=Dyadobacter bucti TaxID=2572203 RepID=UPI003F730CE2